jgi:integrase
MERIAMKKYEVVTIHKGTKYQKKVIRALIRFDKEGNPIPKGDKPRAVVLGSVNDFKYTPSGNIKSLSAFEKDILKKVKDLEESSGFLQTKSDSKKRPLKISRVFDLFLVHYKNTKSKKTLQVPRASTVKKMKMSFQKYLAVYGDHSSNRFQHKHQEKFMLSAEINLSRRSLISYASELNLFLKWAFETNHISESVQLQKPAKTKKDFKVRTFTDEDQDKIEEHILFKYKSALGGHKVSYLNWYRAFFLFRYRGLRAGDVFRLKLEDIRLDENRILLKPVNQKSTDKFGKVQTIEGTTKSRAMEMVPLSSNLKEFLIKDLKNRNSEEIWYLDRGNGNHQFSDCDALTHAFSRILKALNLTGVAKPIHGHRSSLGTKLVNINPALAQMALRHQDIRTTIDSYYDQDSKPLVDAFENLDF